VYQDYRRVLWEKKWKQTYETGAKDKQIVKFLSQMRKKGSWMALLYPKFLKTSLAELTLQPVKVI
jgi:hypothetical protein